MEPVEAAIIEKIQRFQALGANDYHLEREIEADLKAIVDNEQYFGHLSEAFISHSDLVGFLNDTEPFELDYYFLRFKIEGYLLAVQKKEPSQTEKLNEVEAALKKCLAMDTSTEKKKSGTALLPSRLMEYQFIRHLFLTENEPLIRVFLKYLPMPPAEVFDGYPLPEIIAKRQEDSTKTIDAMREDANTPYTPQCNAVEFPDLAERIMDAAKEVKLFDTVKHLTDPAALGKILEGGLYGRH